MAKSAVYKGDVPQHEDYAITGKANQEEDFGMQPHNHKDRGMIMSEPGTHRRPALKDHKRGIRTHDGFHPLPDHGPFFEDVN